MSFVVMCIWTSTVGKAQFMAPDMNEAIVIFKDVVHKVLVCDIQWEYQACVFTFCRKARRTGSWTDSFVEV